MPDDFMIDAPLAAQKKKVYQLTAIDRPIPSVGIFDEPTRCYKINQEWARIVIGFVSLLARPELWQDAENELYEPIQAVMQFLIGDDCMNCDDLKACLADLQILIDIQQDLYDLRDYTQYGDSTIDLSVTTVPDIFTIPEQLETIGNLDFVGCNPDEIWGAVNSLVDYIHKTNEDFLQRVAQGTNLAAQMERAISATPIIGWFPADEAVGLVDWYANEANLQYAATVDEALLQQTKCDLFCLAINSNPCGLNFLDLINYFSGKVPASAGQFVDTLSNLILFAVTGTFVGSDYFYYMCLFQLSVAAIGEKFFNTRGKETYAIYAAAGKNSPDSDWALFCDECPQNGYIEYDFTLSAHGFTSTDATWQEGQGWVANITEPSSGNYRAAVTIVKSYPITGQIFGGGMVFSAISNCGTEEHYWRYYLDSVEEGGRQVGSMPNADNYHITFTNATTYAPEGFDEVRFRINPADCDGIEPHGRGVIHKGRVWLKNTGELKGIPSVVFPSGLPASGSTSMDYWQ